MVLRQPLVKDLKIIFNVPTPPSLSSCFLSTSDNRETTYITFYSNKNRHNIPYSMILDKHKRPNLKEAGDGSCHGYS